MPLVTVCWLLASPVITSISISLSSCNVYLCNIFIQLMYWLFLPPASFAAPEVCAPPEVCPISPFVLCPLYQFRDLSSGLPFSWSSSVCRPCRVFRRGRADLATAAPDTGAGRSCTLPDAACQRAMCPACVAVSARAPGSRPLPAMTSDVAGRGPSTEPALRSARAWVRRTPAWRGLLALLCLEPLDDGSPYDVMALALAATFQILEVTFEYASGGITMSPSVPSESEYDELGRCYLCVCVCVCVCVCIL